MANTTHHIDPSTFLFEPGADGSSDRLRRFDTDDTGPFASEEGAKDATQEGAKRLGRQQLMLEAHGQYGVLILFQGMDASGKDEAIHHVMSVLDPQACSAKSFSKMNEDEEAHDYLWRAIQALPARGKMAVFNRSYYEQVVAERVSPEFVREQPVPPRVKQAAEDGRLWDERYRQIRDVERYLVENGIHIVKLFLHVSNEAQRQRLLERIERPEKRWDFSRADVEKREDWGDFMDAYEKAFQATSTDYAPWHIIPADNKWFARAAAAAVVTDQLQRLHDDFPEPDDELAETLEWGRKELEKQGEQG